MEFLNPEFLWAGLGLPLLWLFPRSSRALGHKALRTLTFALLIGALARPVSVSIDENEHQVFILDQSTSVLGDSDQRAQVLAQWAAGLPKSRTTTLITFGSDDGSLPEKVTKEFDRHLALPKSPDESPIALALEAASNWIPDGSKGAITLLTDGLATKSGTSRIAQQLGERDVPVHCFELPAFTDDAFPIRVEPLQPLRAGQTARLRVDLHGQGARGDVSVHGPEGELARVRDVSLTTGAQAWLEFETPRVDFLPLEVRLEVGSGPNSVTSNDQLIQLLPVKQARRVLYLGERQVGGEKALSELVGPGYEFEAWQGDELTPARLANFDLCVLDDAPRSSFSEQSLRQLRDAVEREGLGLFASGGKAAFGPGGYHDSPLADLLPVEFVQKEEKRDPSTTLVVIIDTSGSMGGNRVQLAKEVARLAIRRLLPHDKVGLVEFYGAKRWAAPIQPASNSIEIERALNRLDAGGGTVILPAIEEAFYGLKNVQTRYKHVLILTDGGVETGAFEPLLRRMANDGINTSTVLIGPEAHSEFLVTLANWGRGRFYSVPNRFNLPEILLKQPASSKLPAYRPGRHAVQASGGRSWWGDVEASAMPDLAGYVETRERPGAQILVETLDGAHPVLGSWRWGLGRVTAFTSEPTGAGTESWRDWDGFGPWLARVLERTASNQREPYRYELRREGAELWLSAQRMIADASPPRARLLDEERELSFRQRSPDRFEARFFADPASDLRLLAEAGTLAGTQVTPLASIRFADLSKELQVDPAGALDLSALSNATRGQFQLWNDNTSFRPTAGGESNPRALRKWWPWMLIAALALFLIELYYRRRPQRVVVPS